MVDTALLLINRTGASGLACPGIAPMLLLPFFDVKLYLNQCPLKLGLMRHNNLSQNPLIKANALSYNSITICNSAL